MVDVFHSRIRASIADKNLQSALDANAERRVTVRQNAFAALPNPQELRTRAHLVRTEVIANLNLYLEQFTDHLNENGIVVHRAKDATEAINIVLEIADQKKARLIAKSKTMISEEIGLNHALEKHGLNVIETDLGEYIVQLRGEAPSHIITPAVHLRRQDVGKLFAEKLGIPYTEDIGIMTNAARITLRQVFLDAEIGISGVNFGVAETGTLCVVTNEGNGRMVTTLPKTHIALMGIERLLPSMADLSLMLTLLPRSATGQKLSVYTNLINSPRKAEDSEGPQERHLILVDNGRSAVRESELQEILYCIRCGSCLNACPVFREIGGHAYVGYDGKGSAYPGPMGSVVSPALFGQLEFGHLARASSLCGACKEACPVDIDLPKLLLRIRAGIGVNHNRNVAKPNAPAVLSIGLGLFTAAATSSKRFGLTQWLAGLFGSVATVLSKGNPWMHLPAFSGWGFSKDFPSPAAKSFRKRFNSRSETISGEYEKSPAQSITSTLSDQKVEISPNQDRTLLSKFSDELEMLGGKFTKCRQNDAWKIILEILQANSIQEIMAWDATYLPDGLLDRLSKSGIRIIFPTGESFHGYAQVNAGLTGALAAIADTGSILILGGPGRPLTASLLPDFHIALLREKDVYEHLDQVIQIKEIREAPSAVLISGPSRTADIEMTLTIGVHGPGKLHVICLED